MKQSTIPMTATSAASAATFSQLADRVPYGAQLQMAELALRRLRQKRDQLLAERNELAREYRVAEDRGRATGKARIDDLEKQIQEIEREISAARPAVSAMRVQRATKVAQALRPVQQEAARKAVAAITTLHDAVATLAEVADILRRSGDADQPPVPVPPVASVHAYAARIIG